MGPPLRVRQTRAIALDRVPAAIWAAIFVTVGELSPGTLIMAIPAVCYRWRDICRNDLYVRSRNVPPARPPARPSLTV